MNSHNVSYMCQEMGDWEMTPCFNLHHLHANNTNTNMHTIQTMSSEASVKCVDVLGFVERTRDYRFDRTFLLFVYFYHNCIGIVIEAANKINAIGSAYKNFWKKGHFLR